MGALGGVIARDGSDGDRSGAGRALRGGAGVLWEGRARGRGAAQDAGGGSLILDIIRDDGPEVRRTIEQRHYLRRWPDPRSIPFAYRLVCDGTPLARDG